MKTIVIDGIVGFQVTGRSVRQALDEAGGAPVRVEISSPGGYVVDGLEIFNRLRNYRGEVHTHVMGEAASMASYIALAGNRRTAEDNAVFMIHNVWSLGIGDHRELRAQADILEGLTNTLAKGYAQATGKTLDEIRQLMNDETFYFGDEISEAGFVDSITSGGDNSQAKATREDAIAFTRLSVKNCLAEMKRAEENRDDVDKIAAMLGELNNVQDVPGDIAQDDNNNAADQGGEPKQEASIMDRETLQRDHSALYNEILQDGKEAGRKEEKDRVAGHLEMAKSTGAVEFAHECIEGDAKITDQKVAAKYMSAGLAKGNQDDREADNVDEDLGAGDDTQDTAAAEAELLDGVMSRSRKTGAPVKDNGEV